MLGQIDLVSFTSDVNQQFSFRHQVSYTRYNTVAADVPWIVKKATGLSSLEFVSETKIDYVRKEMITRSQNVTMRGSLLVADEITTIKEGTNV